MHTAEEPIARHAESVQPSTSPQAQALTCVIHRPVVDTSTLSGLKVTMPGRHRAAPHTHDHSELVVHVLDGQVSTLWGEAMHPMPHQAGTMVYISAGLPHAGVSSDEHGCVLTEIRTDPRGNHDVQLRPDLTDRAERNAAAAAISVPDYPRPVAVELPAGPGTGYQGPLYRPVIHSGTAPVQALSAGWLGLPPGGRVEQVWVHSHTERIMYCLRGRMAVLWVGRRKPTVLVPGHFLWCPRDLPYTVINLSSVEPAVATEYRSDPHWDRDLMKVAGHESALQRQVEALRAQSTDLTPAAP